MTTASPRLVDTQAAAIAVGRRVATIRSWIHRGRIQAHGVDHRGRTLAEIYRTAAPGSTENRHADRPVQH